MIDKNLFPKEYAAIERLKERSRQFERNRKEKRNNKQALIEECRRRLDEQEYTVRRNG